MDVFLSREKGDRIYQHRWLCLCIWVSQEAAAHLLQRNSKRLRNWTRQVPLEMHLQSRTENRIGSNSPSRFHFSPSSDLKPSDKLPKSMQPGNCLPPPPISHLNARQVASSWEGRPTETRQGWRRGEGTWVQVSPFIGEASQHPSPVGSQTAGDSPSRRWREPLWKPTALTSWHPDKIMKPCLLTFLRERSLVNKPCFWSSNHLTQKSSETQAIKHLRKTFNIK